MINMTDNEEYKILRDEMILTYQTIANYNIALFTAAGLIFSFTLEKENYLYSLIPLLIILPLYLLREEEHKKACYIGAYLNVFCEGKSFNWERRHHHIDEKIIKKRDFREEIPYILLSGVCCFTAVNKIVVNEKISNWFAIIPSVLFIIAGIIINKAKTDYVKERNAYIKMWRKQQKEEHIKKKNISTD